MYFGYPLPWWALVLLVLCSALVAAITYGLGAGRSSGPQLRGRLLPAALRTAALLLLLLALFRPLLVAEQRDERGTIVPILVDQSRSMRIADLDGRRRIDVAVDLLVHRLLPALGRKYQPEVLGFADAVSAASPGRLSSPDGRRTDLGSALRAVRDRYRDRPLAGVVVLSDGGSTDEESRVTMPAAPVFTVGVGGVPPDREVASLIASESTLEASLVDLEASVVSRGLGTGKFDVRLVANADDPSKKKTIDVRQVTAPDGIPTSVRFSVPSAQTPIVYAVEIPSVPAEAVRENNSRSILVMPSGRKRRILFVEGAPGFEHSFLRRAWAADPAIEIDSVVRKGKNEQGQDTFLVQADGGRASTLTTGYPTTKPGLFGYDAIVFGSVEWDFLSRDQLAMTAEFVRERGGGVLVLGARSFVSPGLSASALDEALPLMATSGRQPVALTAGGTGEAVTKAAGTAGRSSGSGDRLRLTADGRDHPIMRVAAEAGENERQWEALPALAAVNVLGGLRAGASVLAVADVNGSARPVVAVQRYGRGRTMEFAGEGSWRWKMLMPSADRTHELFWRQAVRWLAAEAPDPVTIVPPAQAQPGTTPHVDVLAADEEFRPVANGVVTVRITAPDGRTETEPAALSDQNAGRYSAAIRIDEGGLYRVEAEARRGSHLFGTATRTILAGGEDPEFADPRLNDAALRRIAAESGGRYLGAGDLGALSDLLNASTREAATTPEPRDIWRHPLVFALVATLLGAEWVLRKKRGLA